MCGGSDAYAPRAVREGEMVAVSISPCLPHVSLLLPYTHTPPSLTCQLPNVSAMVRGAMPMLAAADLSGRPAAAVAADMLCSAQDPNVSTCFATMAQKARSRARACMCCMRPCVRACVRA